MKANLPATALGAIIAMAAVASPAWAADGEPWSVTVSPYVWAASLDGKAALAGFRTHVDVPFSEVFDHLDFALFGDVEIRKGRWGVFIDGQYVKTSQEENLLSQELDLGVTTSRAQGAVFYRIYDSLQGGDTATGAPRRFTIDPMAGVRWNRLKAHVEVLGLTTSKKAEWTEPFVGVKSSWDVGQRWNLSGEADVGGFGVDGKKSANAQAFVGYRTYLLQRPSMLKVGYRTFYQRYDTGDFTGQTFRWSVTQQGPVVGLSMTF
jgi:hypothetical protein